MRDILAVPSQLSYWASCSKCSAVSQSGSVLEKPVSTVTLNGPGA